MGVQFKFVDRGTPMGATIGHGGATFRTWAPRARAVYLVLEGECAAAAAEGWQPSEENRLTPLGDETWGGFLAGVGEGYRYMFWVAGLGSQGLKRDPYARELTTDPAFPACCCILRSSASYPWHDGLWRAPDFRDLVIYQLHVGTWWALDARGVDVRATRGGWFLDVGARLGYLRALHINAIQLLPIQEYPTRYSEGYNGVDYYSPEGLYQIDTDEELARYLKAVNATLGSFGKAPLTADQLRPGVNQLKCLIDLAHLHGIAVIFDLVYNHAGGDFGDRSIWFYDRFADANANNSLYFTDQGWAGGRVFAFWNEHVRQFLIDNATFFLNEYRIDGIRYDEVRVISNNQPCGRELCRDLTSTVRFVKPQAIQIAEYWDWDRALPVTPAPEGLGFDAAIGDGLRDAVRTLLSEASGGENAQLQLDSVAQSFSLPQGYSASWQIVQCLENHDVTYAAHSGSARLPMLADPVDRRSWYARSRTRAAAALLVAAPGIPSLFMGEEILEDKPWIDDEKDHPGHLIWWQGLETDRAMSDYLRYMQDLIALRRQEPALRGEGARVSRVNNYDRLIVVHRWIADGSPGLDVLAVMSFDERPKSGYRVGFPQRGRWRELFNSDFYDGFPNRAAAGNGGSVEADGPPLDGFGQSAALTIPANGALFFSQGA
jgi:1,4-alpha-glucan branching enzyme